MNDDWWPTKKDLWISHSFASLFHLNTFFHTLDFLHSNTAAFILSLSTPPLWFFFLFSFWSCKILLKKARRRIRFWIFIFCCWNTWKEFLKEMAFCSSTSKFSAFFLIHLCLLLTLSFAEDPFVTYNFEVSYITASPLGVPQQVCSLDLSIFCSVFLFFTRFLLLTT